MLHRRMKHTRKGVALDLPPEERDVLRALIPQMRSLLSHGDHDPSTRRLFPTAYPTDPEADAEYRQLMHDDLLGARLSRLDLFEASLDAELLDDERAMAWLGALNDLRLVLGTKLDVSEDMDIDELPDDDPSSPAYSLYSYLGWLQEQLIAAISR
jgi:hypothetical protein